MNKRLCCIIHAIFSLLCFVDLFGCFVGVGEVLVLLFVIVLVDPFVCGVCYWRLFW